MQDKIILAEISGTRKIQTKVPPGWFVGINIW